jgi:hypothetical protein
MMHIFSHFCFWLFSIFLYLALRPVDFAMGMVLSVVGFFCLLAIYFFMKGLIPLSLRDILLFKGDMVKK